MSTPTRLLTVCLGNICRSPTAEAALRVAAVEAGIALEVDSAGTGDWHLGASPDRRMCAAGDAVGLRLEGVAAQVDAAALAAADLVLAMDASNLTDLQRLAARHASATPIRRFRVFDPLAHGGDLDVPDPYYGGADGFAEVVEMCRRTAAALVAQLAAGTPVDQLTGHPDPLAPLGHAGGAPIH